VGPGRENAPDIRVSHRIRSLRTRGGLTHCGFADFRLAGMPFRAFPAHRIHTENLLAYLKARATGEPLGHRKEHCRRAFWDELMERLREHSVALYTYRDRRTSCAASCAASAPQNAATQPRACGSLPRKFIIGKIAHYPRGHLRIFSKRVARGLRLKHCPGAKTLPGRAPIHNTA
jgi:hypothetical protein